MGAMQNTRMPLVASALVLGTALVPAFLSDPLVTRIIIFGRIDMSRPDGRLFRCCRYFRGSNSASVAWAPSGRLYTVDSGQPRFARWWGTYSSNARLPLTRDEVQVVR